MLVLFDTPAGHALFKVLKPAALEKPESLWDSFTSLEGTNKMYAAAQCRGRVHLTPFYFPSSTSACLLCVRIRVRSSRASHHPPPLPRGAA